MRLLLASLALIALLVPAAAQAGRVNVSSEEPESPPELAGNQVVYLDYTGARNLIRAAAPGAVPHTLRTFPVGGADEDCCASFVGVGLDASPTRLATLVSVVNNAKGVVVGSDAKLEAGPLAGPATTMFECQSGGDFEPGGFDLDSDRLAFIAGGCGSGGRSIVVRDLSTGADVANVSGPAGKGVWDVQVAGSYLAYSTSAGQSRSDQPREVTLRDLQTGTDLLTVPALAGFDVQADGKLVINSAAAAASGCPATVDWYSPGEPTRHATGICSVSAPHVAGDRIVVERRAPGTEATDVVVSDLAGNTRTLVSAGSILGLGGADFDGTRVAYVANTCVPGEASVYVDDLGPEDPVTIGADCPIKPRGSKLRASGKGQVSISFSCPKGCGGSVQLLRGGGDLLSPERNFAGGAGRVTVRLKLTRAARRLLARRGQLKASIEGVSKTLDKDGSRPFLRKVTLLAPRRSR